MLGLQGKIAIVTGASRGIGRACALRLAREGASVVLSDIQIDLGEQTARDIRSEGGVGTFIECDVGDSYQVQDLVGKVDEEFGSVDILVNNAGVVHKADLLSLAEAELERVLRVNLKGAFLMSQAVSRVMIRHGRGGAIVNVSSINGQVAIPNQLAYCISKGALNQLTKSTAISLAANGIRVNAVSPGSIDTELLKGVVSDPEAVNSILSRTPLGRIGNADEIAGAVAFLASDDANYITGEILNIDGGRLALNGVMSTKVVPPLSLVGDNTAANSPVRRYANL